jgi:hypothetical protein
MALSQTDLDAIDSALKYGELEVRIDDKIIRYQSADDLLKRRAAIVAILAAQSDPNRVIPRHQLADFSDDA